MQSDTADASSTAAQSQPLTRLNGSATRQPEQPTGPSSANQSNHTQAAAATPSAKTGQTDAAQPAADNFNPQTPRASETPANPTANPSRPQYGIVKDSSAYTRALHPHTPIHPPFEYGKGPRQGAFRHADGQGGWRHQPHQGAHGDRDMHHRGGHRDRDYHHQHGAYRDRQQNHRENLKTPPGITIPNAAASARAASSTLVSHLPVMT